MIHKFNKKSIAGGVIALLFTWAFMVFYNIDLAVLFVCVLIALSISVWILVDTILPHLKRSTEEFIEPKEVSKEEKAKPVTTKEISDSLKNMGYTVDSVTEDKYILFHGDIKYLLFTEWIHIYQTNYMYLELRYSITNSDDVNTFSQIADKLNRNIKIGKVFVVKEEESYRLSFYSETLYWGNEPLQQVILSLVACVNSTLDKFSFMTAPSEVEDNVEDNAEDNILNDIKTSYSKYSC